MAGKDPTDQILDRLCDTFQADLGARGCAVDGSLIRQFSRRIFLVGYILGYDEARPKVDRVGTVGLGSGQRHRLDD